MLRKQRAEYVQIYDILNVELVWIQHLTELLSTLKYQHNCNQAIFFLTLTEFYEITIKVEMLRFNFE